jgi:hypothetical protein
MVQLGATGLLLLLLLDGAGGEQHPGAPPPPVGASLRPVSYWRFEESDNLGADSVRPGEPLRPTGSSTWSARPFASGGIVGGYAAVDNATVAALGGSLTGKLRAGPAGARMEGSRVDLCL